MQALAKNGHGVIGDNYHMTVMDENVKWLRLAHPLSDFSLNFRAPFCTVHLSLLEKHL
jgi:hypothetical protein